MEQPKEDEEIVCTGCGVTFVFTAAAAASRAERGNTNKPTMCRSCWRAKSATTKRPQDDAQDRSSGRHGRAPQRQPQQQSGWGYRTTGDVNEYRSPMPDPHFSGTPIQQPRGWGRTPSAGRRVGWGDGNYRAPSFQNEQRAGARRPGPDRNGSSRSNDGGPSRMRSRTSTDITCAACGTSATVPFKPAEGQKVYCQACYRSEKPS